MFYHYDDQRFKKIIDEFILSTSSDDDKQLTRIIKNIDYQASKLGISFYRMMFILIQKESIEKRKKKKEMAKNIN